ncbi:uncharacterized protein VTP21DRAFT_6293 [Calcarisporiella thermophila]|uniref:uncharacterized protein n=1 Tax=Calcarisporiella thermophila TaxID=911321 RepID=UPI0037435FA5
MSKMKDEATLADDTRRNSRMSITELCNNQLHSNQQPPDDETLAAEALDSMRTAGDQPPTSDSEHFIARISNIPMIATTLRTYEASKANSRLVRYGAEMVESSVRTLAGPVIGRLNPHLSSLDEFACRQLDKLEKKYPSTSNDQDDSTHTLKINGHALNNHSSSELRRRRPRNEDSQLVNNKRGISHSRGTYGEENGNSGNSESVNTKYRVATIQQQPRSRWHQITMEVGTSVGAGAAIVSEEGMKSLRYCLEWLQYAIGQVEYQIALLRSYISRITNPSNTTALTQSDMASSLTRAKRDVVNVLRRVVEVVSRYAGNFLPEQARRNVRSFILSLPLRWAQMNQTADRSSTSSPASSPGLRPMASPVPPSTHAIRPAADPEEAAKRVLDLAVESREMLQSIAGIFGDTIQRAESWLGRLRVVGVGSDTTSNGERTSIFKQKEVEDEDEGAVMEREEDDEDDDDDEEEEEENKRMTMMRNGGGLTTSAHFGQARNTRRRKRRMLSEQN